MSPLTKQGTCLICERYGPLRNSHIIPKLFRRAIARKLGSTPGWRNLGAPTKKEQDLPKHYLCCDACEQLLSVDEGRAAPLFYGGLPLPVRYGSWMLPFATGLVTKAAGVNLFTTATRRLNVESLPAEERPLLLGALALWRKVLLNGATPGRYELHLLNFDMADYPNLRTACGHTLLWNPEFKAVLVYMNGILVVGVVESAARLLTRATRITVKGSTVTAACLELPAVISNALQQLSDNYGAEQAAAAR